MSPGVRVNFIVEGQTEETFVRDVMGEPLANLGVYVAARCVETGRKHGQTFRGGMTSYARTKRDILRWLAEDQSAYLTTMFDLYRLPADFPTRSQSPAHINPYDKVRNLETAFAQDIQNERFIPHIQLYEFEGLLFSNVQAIDAILKIYRGGRSQLKALEQARSQVKTPEEIDDGDTTAPSKRLKSLYPAYDKPAFGPRIAQRIGLDTLRRECPHLHEWVSGLEALAEQA
jgi:hypothetical protein